MACASDSSRFRLVTLSRVESSLAAEVAAGLRARPKRLPCKFFYDAAGQALFERICDLPEYYLTRTETAILREHADAIMLKMPWPQSLVELGSGNSRKIHYLIEPLLSLLQRQQELVYNAVDVSPEALVEAGRELTRQYAGLKFVGLVGDFADGLRYLREQDGPPQLVAFLGSTIGNFDEAELDVFFRTLRHSLRHHDVFLLGFDLRKDADVLIAAYDDAAGVTAAFNRNLLVRINRELGANFDVASFAHRAVFDDQRSRIEMHLVSTKEQIVHIPAIDLEIRFAANETIHTENCYKHSRAGMDAILRRHHLRELRSFTDRDEMFCVSLVHGR